MLFASIVAISACEEKRAADVNVSTCCFQADSTEAPAEKDKEEVEGEEAEGEEEEEGEGEE
jgi:hypothetical protein